MEQFPSNFTISFQILFMHTLLCQHNCFVSVQLLNISSHSLIIRVQYWATAWQE